MAILVKGTDFTTGQQVSAANLDNLVDLATFDTGAVDNSTTQLSGGAIIVKDGGITSAKLATNIAVTGTLSAGGATTLSSTLGVTGATTLSSTLAVTGAATLSGGVTGGLAVTGAISATGAISSAGTVTITGSGSSVHFTNAGAENFVQSANTQNFIGINQGTSTVRIAAANTTIAQFSSTGLAVTGAISATGALTLGTDLAVTEGGTGASTASGARTNLGLVIGTDVQAYSSVLATYAGINPSSNVQTLLGAADYSAFRTSLGVAIGTNVQAYSANLTTYAGIAPSSNVQTLLGAANYSAFRSSLGVAIGTDVQAYNANLTTYAGITPSANVQSLLGAADYSAMRTQLSLVVGTNVQAFDADLSALAALSGTNNIYYRSGAATWSSVAIGPGLSFSGGTLSSTVSGIGGSTGSTDNRILRADGTGGSTLQASGITIDDSDNLTGVTTCDVGTGGYKVSGTKVIGAQSAAEADISLSTSLSGGDTVSEAALASNFGALNGKINSILAKLRTHGLFAT